MNKNDRGFSLTELTVMLGMIAILSAFSIPALNSAMQDMQLNADAKSIATTLTYAKVHSSSQMARYRVSFILGTNQWRLEKFNPGTSGYDLEQATNTLSTGMAKSGITFQASADEGPPGFETLKESSTEITFDSRGLPMGTTGYEAGIIYLSNDNIDFAVSVSISGKVQLWRLQDGQWNRQ